MQFADVIVASHTCTLRLERRASVPIAQLSFLKRRIAHLMRKFTPAWLLAFCVSASLCSAETAAAQSQAVHSVDGRLRLPGMHTLLLLQECGDCPQAFSNRCAYAVFADQSVKSSKIKLILSINGGNQLHAFPTVDGSFSFPAVPAGTHMLDVISIDMVFPQVKLHHRQHILALRMSIATETRQKKLFWNHTGAS